LWIQLGKMPDRYIHIAVPPPPACVDVFDFVERELPDETVVAIENIVVERLRLSLVWCEL